MKRLAISVLLMTLTAAGANLRSARVATTGPLLEYLPDGNAVAIIDFQKIKGSSVWAVINAQDKLKAEIDKAQSEMSTLGITLGDVHTVALVFSGASVGTPTVALSGGFEQNDVLSRLRASARLKLSSEKYKGVDIYTARPVSAAASTGGSAETKASAAEKPTQAQSQYREAVVVAAKKDETSFVFHDSTTLVVGSLDAVRASVDVKTGAKPGLTQNTQLSSALAQNPSAAVRFALSMTSSMASGLKSSDLPIDLTSLTLIFGTIDIGQSIDLDFTLRNDNAEHARALSERLSALLSLASGLVGSMSDPKLAKIGDALKTITINSADTDVRITGSVPMDLLNSLISSTTKK